MHNTNGVVDQTVEIFWKLVSKIDFRNRRFCPINALDVWKTYVCQSAVFKMKQVKSKNRNRMAVETLDESHRLANTGSRDEHWTGLGLDWIRTMTNFVEFGLDPDCKLLHKFRIRK